MTEKIALAREARSAAEADFRRALRAGHKSGLSWSQLATASGMSRTHVRYLILNLNDRRREARKGEKNGAS